ncbi:conserved hypothetical protein [Ricinus communis]|uniref:Uncharacterized protein n=1 Tax=Ricinus communis TaxID=3988 RepID=B9S1D2_RICCO|nr:conserved hypothetical protein [Ricinus communis]
MLLHPPYKFKNWKRSGIGILDLVPWCIRGGMNRLASSTMIDCTSGGPRVRDQIGSERRYGVHRWLIGPLSNFKGNVLLSLGIDAARLGARDQDRHSILGFDIYG